jgi:DNA-binding SARP family transcriptional activator
MLCYLQLGRRGDAIRQFEVCKRHLADDLSLTPAPKLEALHRSITSGSGTLPDTLGAFD